MKINVHHQGRRCDTREGLLLFLLGNSTHRYKELYFLSNLLTDAYFPGTGKGL